MWLLCASRLPATPDTIAAARSSFTFLKLTIGVPSGPSLSRLRRTA